MSLQPVISRQIDKSLSFTKNLADLAGSLIEDASIRLEKPQLTPMLTVEALCGSACAITESEARVRVGTADGFFNVTSKRAREYVRLIVGASPDIISDLAEAIVDPIVGAVEGIVEAIDDVIQDLLSFIQEGFDFIVDQLSIAFSSVGNFVSDTLDYTIKKTSEGFNFVTGSINALLEGVANAFDTFTLVIQQQFSLLMKGLDDLLRVTPQALFQLQQEFSRLIQEQQASLIKGMVGEL